MSVWRQAVRMSSSKSNKPPEKGFHLLNVTEPLNLNVPVGRKADPEWTSHRTLDL